MMSVTRAMLEETGTQPEDADGLINYAKRIQDVRVAVLIQEQIGNYTGNHGRNYHVSLRSDGSVDVAAIASCFGGGGHHSAAGFTIRCKLSDLKCQICELTDCL